MNKIASFDIHYSQYLDKTGKLTQSLPDTISSVEQLVPVYEAMVLNRVFDTKAIALQRTGQLGTYPSSLGQEAITAGVGAAMLKEDVLLPSYREHGAMLWRGVRMTDILLYWGGDERGSDYAVPTQDFPVSVPIATQMGHATGVATAFKLRKEKRVAVGMCGDGGTSKGDFYEALNVAGVWNLPAVFVVSNNQWAISVPLKSQTAAQTIAQKAVAGGFEGIQVDGNDIIAVYDAMKVATEKARNGGGPTLIEAITYRMSDHTTADDASRYRSNEEVESHKEADPIERLKTFLIAENCWSDAQEETLRAEIAKKVEEAVKAYLDTPVQSIESIFDYHYAELPADLAEQRAEAMERS